MSRYLLAAILAVSFASFALGAVPVQNVKTKCDGGKLDCPMHDGVGNGSNGAGNGNGKSGTTGGQGGHGR